MMAKKKPIENYKAAEMGVDISLHLTVRHVAHPPPRKAGIRVASVHELVEKLRSEAKVVA